MNWGIDVVTLVLKPNICQDFLVSDMVYFWRGDDSAAAVETIRKLAADIRGPTRIQNQGCFRSVFYPRSSAARFVLYLACSGCTIALDEDATQDLSRG